MKLLRIGVANFRSIGAQPVMIDLQKRINLLIGANNSGKSNVLTIFQRLDQLKQDKLIMHGLDRHRRDDGKNLELVFEVERTLDAEWPEAAGDLRFSVHGTTITFLNSPFDRLNFHEFDRYMAHWLNHQWGRYAPNSDQLLEAKQNSALRVVGSLTEFVPSVHVIPQFRQIVPGEYNPNGTGIVELLAHWKSPEIEKESDRERFHKLVAFLRELLGMDDITLDVSRKSTELIVERTKLRLPLKNYGTGIHQLIILAIAVLAQENAWIAIEEPEIHLHPLLQKAFLRFLIEKTTNNYILTTHSNAFLSRPQDSHIVHLWLEDGETKNRVVETTGHILEVLNDLGIRASDILQANFVIWVEGPSDRIYLNHWLKLADPELAEGIDYSIMFYGGRLLSHLTMERENGDLTTDELIKLLRINQHSAILIDSDRKKGSDEVNATKTRIKKECKADDVMCWVTEGREVENYIPPEAFAATYKEMTAAERVFKVGRLDKIESVLKKAYRTVWKPKLAYDEDKVGFARKIIPQMKELPDRFDLRERIKELVARIHKAR